MRTFLYAVTFTALIAVGLIAQGQGGAFLPSASYTLTGNNTFSGANTFSGTTAFTGVATLTSPVLVTPALGVATATSINGNILTTGSSTYTGTAGQTYTFPTTSATIARTDAANTFTGVQTFSSAPVVGTITNTGTLTLPTATGGLPATFDCASTGSGNQTCSPTAAAVTTKIYSGKSTLSGSAATITFPVSFTASTNFSCVANDVTTRANVVQMVPASANTATITNTTGASDVIQWICIGQ